MKKHILFTGLIMIFLMFSCRKGDYYLDNISVVHDLGGGTGTVTWTKDQSYVLDGFVFVNDGQVLTIEAGTVIRAKTGQGSHASALIVARGGKIIASGTAEEPIIFTVEGDDLKGSVPLKSRGLWGGLIILGNAPVNTSSGEASIEGIPISEPRGIYGGYDADDNSGILEYVSVRHGGTNIGEGNEINGLTLGGVGRKTTIDHIEVIANADDGVEFFGGTVDCRNMAVAFCGDDAFDFDQGYSGKCQFLLGILDEDLSDHAAEHNGGVPGSMGKGLSKPEIYNATYIGGGQENPSWLISFDTNSGGIYRNSIFLNSRKGIGIEDTGGGSSFTRLGEGDLEISHNVFYDVAGNKADSIIALFGRVTPADSSFIVSYFAADANSIDDDGLVYDTIPYDLLPVTTAFTSMAEYSSDWYEKVTYKGAFGSNNWLQGWSVLQETGQVK
ncbi:MAG TPA: hypothetical protein VE870_16355 [Bacteroidales bacterium]|nr:hypothetical protein [Bacteroidales bacterium]